MSDRLPGLRSLLSLDRSSWRTELAGGLTVGAMLVPQGMAYAELAGMDPITGCYAAILPLLTYALVGSSRHLGVGPEPGTAILAATGVGALAAGDPTRYAALMGALAAMVGALALLAWVLRMGFLAELLGKPVLVGYITGVGLTLIASQLGKATAVPIQADGPFARVFELATRLDEVHLATLLLFVSTVALQLVLRTWWPRLPAALIAVAGATALGLFVDLPAMGVAVIGDLPTGLPTPELPWVGAEDLKALLPTALGVALVGYTDNVLTARAIGAKLGYRVDADQELLALGFANVGAAVLQGFPVSSSASRTAVPASLGTRSTLVHLIAVATLVTALVLLPGALAAMPVAALAAVIVVAGWMILDGAGFRRLWQVDRRELTLAVATTAAVMAIDVLQGVLLAVAASGVMVLYRIAVPHDAVLASSAHLDGWVDARQYGLVDAHEGLLVYRFDAPLFFANATRYRERLLRMLEEKPGEERWVVLDFEGIGDVDATAVEMLEALFAELETRGVQAAVARANPVASERLSVAGLLHPHGPVRHHATILGAVRATELARDLHVTVAGGTNDGDDR